MEASADARPRLKGSKSTSPCSARFNRLAKAGSPIRFPIVSPPTTRTLLNATLYGRGSLPTERLSGGPTHHSEILLDCIQDISKDAGRHPGFSFPRSEERRVGKECR